MVTDSEKKRGNTIYDFQFSPPVCRTGRASFHRIAAANTRVQNRKLLDVEARSSTAAPSAAVCLFVLRVVRTAVGHE